MTINEWLVNPQGSVKGSRLVITPDPCAKCLCYGNWYRITPAANPTDEVILAINPDTDLDGTINVSQVGYLIHGALVPDVIINEHSLHRVLYLQRVANCSYGMQLGVYFCILVTKVDN